MTAPVFMMPTEALRASASEGELLLDGPEGRHAALVRRLRAGERLDVTDGAGTLLRCVVARAGREWLELSVESRHTPEPPSPHVIVVQALPKGDRGETAVETMTEVGVDVIVPWSAARCVTQWRAERADKALSRWRAAAREAAKQSRRAWWPEVRPLAGTAAVAELIRGAALAVTLHESASAPLVGVGMPTAGDVVLVVGPEGGIADDELALFTEAGGEPRRLGPSVLRTSTAGTVAAALVLAATPRWS